MKLGLFVKVPIAYKKIVLEHYKGEGILHDVDHLPYSFSRVCSFERANNVRAIYAFRPKFCDFLLAQTTRLEPEQLCLHYDGDDEKLGRFCSKLGPRWINGHDKFNNRTEVLSKVAERYGLELLKPVVFSDYTWEGDLVEGFLRRRTAEGLFNFHLDYFWPLFRFI